MSSAWLSTPGSGSEARKTLIGAPVTQDFVDKIGADAYGANAASAVEKAKELI